MVEHNDSIHELQEDLLSSNLSYRNSSFTNNQFSGFDSFRQNLEDCKADQNSFNENTSVRMGSIQISPIEAAEPCFILKKVESKQENIFFIRSFPYENDDDSCIESSLGLLAPKYKKLQGDRTPSFPITREDLLSWENAIDFQNKVVNKCKFELGQNFDPYQFVKSGTCGEFDEINEEKIPDIDLTNDCNKFKDNEDKKSHEKVIFTINPAKLIKMKANRYFSSKMIETPTGLKKSKDILSNKIVGFPSLSNPNFKIRQFAKSKNALIHKKTPTSVYETIVIPRESRRDSSHSQAIFMNDKKSRINSVKPIDFRSKQPGLCIPSSKKTYKSLDKLFTSKPCLNQLDNSISKKKIEGRSKKFNGNKSRMVIKQNDYSIY